MNEEQQDEKSPWIWKAVMVGLPVGLFISIVIAVGLKISKGPENEMVKLQYLAGDFDSVSLRDTMTKLEDLIGEPDLDTPQGQLATEQTLALIRGTLGPNNLGYEVKSDEGVTRSGKIWKNYWVDLGSGNDGEGLLLWCCYVDGVDSAALASLLSLAEWMRGRQLTRPVRLAFLVDSVQVRSVTADWSQDSGENLGQSFYHVTRLGRGGQGLDKVSLSSASAQSGHFILQGGDFKNSETDWKLTEGWEHYEQQVINLCNEIMEAAQSSHK